MIANELKKTGLTVKILKSPDLSLETGTILSKFLSGEVQLSNEVAFALFSVNRMEMRQFVNEFVQADNIVLFDRYSESEYAYGKAKGLSYEWLSSMESLMPTANLVIVLDITPECSVKRKPDMNDKDIFEDNLAFLERARINYLDLSQKPIRKRQNWHVVQGENSISSINEEILQIILNNISNNT